MSIVLFQPRTGPLDRINRRLPMGLLYAASYAHKDGHDVRIIDQRLDGWEHALEKALKKALFFGTTCMTGPQIAHALDGAAMAKRAGVPVVFGGIHPTILPEQTLQNALVDMVVRGEGDVATMELANALERGKSVEKIKGISFKRKGKVIHNEDRPFLRGEEILQPPYRLLDMRQYSSVSFTGERSYSIVSSRGCPFRCAFCYNSVCNAGSWRPFPMHAVMENAQVLVDDYNAKTLYFEDDNISVDDARFQSLVNGLHEHHDIGLAFQGIRLDVLGRLSAETFNAMDRLSHLSLDMGIESSSPRILAMVDKSLRIQSVRDALKRLERHDFVCKFNFIIGLPGETMQEVRNDLKFGLALNRRHKRSYSLFNIYTPYPGTKLFSAAVSRGFHPPKSLEGWSRFSQMSWLRPGNTWFHAKEIDYLKNVSFLSMFAKPYIQLKASSAINKAMIRAYSPVARARLQSGFISLLVERTIAEKLS